MDSEKLPQVDDKPVADQRRRLLAGGVAATVIASLKSGSALAEGVCIGPSAFTSVTLNPITSNKPTVFPTCHSHGYWMNTSKHSWPVSLNYKVKDVVFRPGIIPALGISGESTLLSILEAGGGGGDRAFAADLVSAFLDAKANSSLPFDAEDVKKMWSLVFGNAPYTLKTGAVWTDRATVRGFLDVLIGAKANPYK